MQGAKGREMSGKRALVLLLVIAVLCVFAVVTTSCGQPLNSTARTASTRRAMVNLKLAQDRLRIRNDMPGRPSDLRPATRAYLTDLKRSTQTLGSDGVRKLLTDMANELRTSCPPCAKMLVDSERERLG